MASSSSVFEELERTRKMLTHAQKLLESQSLEIATLMKTNEAKDAEL